MTSPTPTSCQQAIGTAVDALGGIDSVVYAPAIGPLARIEELDADTWRATFDTNVIGASLFTAAALPHLDASAGRVVYLSSVSASQTAPWPGLSAYAVSKAALDKLVEAWRAEHPEVGFTRLVVGDCPGGEGDGLTQFANAWDPDLAAEMGVLWVNRGLLAGSFVDVEDLIAAVDGVLRAGPSVSMSTVIVSPRPTAPADLESGRPRTSPSRGRRVRSSLRTGGLSAASTSAGSGCGRRAPHPR